MSDVLLQRFEKFISGECTADVFQRELLALCLASPERAWQALALLDRYYRQRKISADLCRDLRATIGEHAMRLEGHTAQDAGVEPWPAAAAAIPVNPAPAAVAAQDRSAPASPGRSAPEYEPEVRARGGYRLPDPEPVMPQGRPDRDVPLQGFEPLADERVDRLLTQPTQPVKRTQKREREQEQSPPGKSRWRRGFQTSPALGLIAVMLGVAAATRVQDPPAEIQPIALSTAEAPAPAADPAHEPATVSLSSERYLVYPHQKMLKLTVERSAAATGDSSFSWWTQSSGAKSSEDYVGTRARVADIPGGATSTTLQVPILANPQRHHIEMFYVVIGKPAEGTQLGAIRRAAVFIFPPDER
jgi:hypothetical protein